MARKLFGTDGVRGVAGEFLTAELALALGARRDRAQRRERAAAGADRARHARVGRDARGGGRRRRQRSGRRRAARRRAADAGGAVAARAATGSTSASCSRPRTTPTATTASSSSAATATSSPTRPSWRSRRRSSSRRARRAPRSAACASCAGRREDYLRELHTRFERPRPAGARRAARLRQRRDLSRRAGDLPPARRFGDGASPAAPTGATSTTAAARPTSPSSRGRRGDGGHALGFAFDGDGDRVLAVDSRGEVVDGDELLALGALHLRDTGRLPGDGVVVTVMTNYGFHAAMEREGVAVKITPSATAMCSRSCARAAGRSAASSRGT